MKSKHGAMTVEQVIEIDRKMALLYENRAPSVVPERSVGDTLARFLARRMASNPDIDITDTAYIQEYIQSGFTRFSARRIVVKARMLSNEINMMPMALAEPNAPSTDLMIIRTQAIDNTPVQTVNARDLHTFLEVGKDFSTWIKDRIDKYDFIENVDYVSHSPKLGNGENQQVTEFTPGILRKDYYLTLDMAKELSMVERTAKGKEARQYFIKCERLLKAGGAAPKTKPGPKHEKAAAIIITTESLEQFAAQVKTTAALGLSASVSKRSVRPLLVDIIAPEMAAHPNTRNEAYIQDIQLVGVSLRTAQRIVVAARKKSHEISANTALTTADGEPDEK